MVKYDRVDAADASLVVLSEIHRNAKIITTDRRDFSIYRRFGRHRLPVSLPLDLSTAMKLKSSIYQ